MDQVADQNKMQKVYRPGESFFHDVQKLLEPYKDIVRVHQQDLMTYQPPPEPVELLFIDAMKTWPLAQKITTEFFPLLIPGLSVVVQQDFAFHHPIAATNHLIMWRLRDYFEWVHHVPRSASVAFVSKKRIEPDAFPDLSVDSFTLDEINQAYDYSLACVPQDPIREFIEAAKLLFLIERGYYEAALTHGRRLVENKTKFKERVIADSQRIIEEHQKAGVARGVSLPYEGRSVDQSEALAEIASLLPALTT